MSGELWLLEIEAPKDLYDLAQAALADSASWGWEEKEGADGGAVFGVYGEDKQLLAEIGDRMRALGPGVAIRITEAAARDWQHAWREFFTPVEAGTRFVVLPPWLAHLSHTARQEIIIDPKNAFGTGHHASTVLCLAALSELLDKKRIGRHDWFLDLGCGSGILGIAACKSGLSGTGLDIDPAAIANSRENRELNEADGLELLNGGIEKAKGAKYDLIMANILAQPLIDLAPRICAAMEKNGCLILGGLLDSQADAVAAAYMASGLGAPRQLAEGEWRALVWD